MNTDNYTDVDLAVGELYRAFYRLRCAKRYKEEYDSMGTVMHMLMQDREYIRNTYLKEDEV